MKRVIDLLLLLLAIPLWLPLLLLVAIATFVFLGSPVLFRQARGGYRGEIIHLYKFRTMTNETDNVGQLLPDQDRLTRFGKFLRSTSLDELPSLWNLFKGDITLVGPRPFRASYLPLYTDAQMRRHDVRPGITGWAQVKGRNRLSWEEKFALDIWYVDNRSLWLDAKIIAMTLAKVLARHDIDSDAGETMPAFTGTSDSAPDPLRD